MNRTQDFKSSWIYEEYQLDTINSIDENFYILIDDWMSAYKDKGKLE